MHEPPHDERIRHLQRIAYGAVASDAERAAALAELDSLRRTHDSVTDAPAASVAVGPETAQVAADLPEPSPSEPRGDARGDLHGDAARPLTWAIAAGAAALLVGVAVGWQAGTRLTAADPSASDPAGDASVSLSVGSVLAAPVSVADSAAYAVFERPPTPADMPAIDVPDEWQVSADARLLATMPDGMTVYAAKPPGQGIDMCVVVVVPDEPGFGLSCTQAGIFEQGLLSYEFRHPRGGTATVALHADGSVQVTVPMP